MQDLQRIQPDSSASLPTSYAKLRERLGDPLTPEVLALQLSRLDRVFSPGRERTDDHRRQLAREWYEALAGFGAVVVRRSIDHLIAHHTSDFWPVPALAVAWCTRETRELSHAFGPKPEPEPAPAVISVDESARRAAQILKWKSGAGSLFTPEACAEEPARPVAACKPGEHVSPALEAFARKKGIWKGDPDPNWRVKETADVQR